MSRSIVPPPKMPGWRFWAAVLGGFLIGALWELFRGPVS